MIYIDNTRTLIRFPRPVTVGEALEEVAVRLTNTTDRRTLTLSVPAAVDGGYIAAPEGLGGVTLTPGEWEYALETPGGTALGAGIIRVNGGDVFPAQSAVQYEKIEQYEQYFTD